MAKALGVTMCLLSVCGEASNTRRCICELTRASVKPAAPLDSISTSTIASVHIRALTALRRTRLTSPSCPSAWQPNPGRGSTYRRGNSVQRIGTTAVVFIRHIISEVLQYRRHPWWSYRARRHPWSHRGALHYVLFLLSTHRARRHPWWSLFATCPREGYADWTPDIGHPREGCRFRRIADSHSDASRTAFR